VKVEECRNFKKFRIKVWKIETGSIIFATRLKKSSSFKSGFLKNILNNVWRLENELYFCSPFETNRRRSKTN
jgi:hypothetical protein